LVVERKKKNARQTGGGRPACLEEGAETGKKENQLSPSTTPPLNKANTRGSGIKKKKKVGGSEGKGETAITQKGKKRERRQKTQGTGPKKLSRP